MHISNDPERNLIKDIFGIRPIKHPYLRCDECGEEYYKFRPRFCRNCGYAGGAIDNPSFQKIIDTVKYDIRKKYTFEIHKYVPSNKTNKSLYISTRSKNAHPELAEIEQKIDDEFSAMIEPYKIILKKNGPFSVVDQAKAYLHDNVHTFIEKPRVLALILCAMYEITDTSNLEKYNIFSDETEQEK